MKKTQFNPNAIFSVKDTCFYGDAMFIGANLNCEIKFSYVAFHDIFNFEDTILGDKCEFDHIAFNTMETVKMKASKKQLYDVLVASNLKELAENLNLLPDKKSQKSDIDLVAYQIAYNTGWLSNAFAAHCLEKSTNYLYRKREADRVKVTQKSLPFKEDGRDIQYPVEALLAFKAKDWAKLKELRKKYPIPTQKK